MKRKKNILWMMILLVLALASCAGPDGQQEPTQEETQERVDTGFIVTGPDSYDSADTAVLVGKDTEARTLTFLNLDLGRRYTLSYDGTTKLWDKYGEGVSLTQIEKGDIVDVTFLRTRKHLTTMKLSAKSWSLENVERYEIDEVRQEVTIGEDVYKLSENTQYLSQGREIERMDLNAADILSFQGLGSTVLTVKVERGHGYLRLVNDENFVGGWIEIGQSLVQRITENMLLTVPEGNYQVNISYNGGGGVKNVSINRNQETTLDIGDLVVPEPQEGIVLFSLSPATTEIYIDSSQVDTSSPVTLQYGIHQMIARAEGYQSITRYIRVSQDTMPLDVVLDKLEEDEEDEKDNGSSNEDDVVTGYYKVYIDAPEKAEVYLNGNYIGISPCSFRKTAGSHVVTLRRTGYETRSYTISVDDEDKDISYSFADLVKTGDSSGDDTVSSGSASSGDAESTTP